MMNDVRNFQRRSPRRAFTIIEVLVWLGLLGIASLLIVRLFTSSMRVIERSGKAQDATMQFDRMIDALRRDVWAARRIQLLDAHALLLHTAGEKDVRWTINDDGTAVRSSPPQRSEWSSLGADLRLVHREGERSLALATRQGEIILPNLISRVNR